LRRTALILLLLVLVAFAAFDDFCAAATSDPADDVAAVEDNEYLASTSSPAEDLRDVNASPPLCPTAAGGASRETPVGPGAAPSEVGPPADQYPLYIFTSMRC
jgi:hypothetical protein